MKWRLSPTQSIFPPVFFICRHCFCYSDHKRGLLLIIHETDVKYLVHQQWDWFSVSPFCTTIVVVVFFPPFYSTPIAPVCTTSRQGDPEPWGTQNATATSTHRRPITTTWGWVTLKETQKPSRGTPEVSDKDIAEHCFCVLQEAQKSSLQHTPVKGVSKHVTHALCSPLPSVFVLFLPVLPFSPPFIPWGLSS